MLLQLLDFLGGPLRQGFGHVVEANLTNAHNLLGVLLQQGQHWCEGPIAHLPRVEAQADLRHLVGPRKAQAQGIDAAITHMDAEERTGCIRPRGRPAGPQVSPLQELFAVGGILGHGDNMTHADRLGLPCKPHTPPIVLYSMPPPSPSSPPSYAAAPASRRGA
jgi:hypothetical protein